MIADSYVEFKDELIETLSNFPLTSDDHLIQISIGEHLMILSQADAKPSYSTS